MKMDKQTEILMDLSTKLASIDGKMGQLCSSIQNHEQRIQSLEHGNTAQTNWIIQWLIKGLLIALGIIGTTTGSATIISKIVAPTQIQQSK